MEGDHHPAGAVVVDNEVVNADDGGMGHDQFFDLLHKFVGGRRAQQGIDRILGGIEAGPENESRHQDTAPAVDHQTGEAAHQSCDEHSGGGDAVAEGVGGGSQHGGGVQLFPQGAVVKGHIQLHTDGYAQDGNHQPAGVYRSGVQNFIQRGLCQLEAHQDDEHGHRQARQVLDTAVTEGMVRVRLLSRQLKAQQGDEGASGVGQVVEGVGGDGDGAGDGAGKELPGKQENVEANAHRAAEDAVPLAEGGLVPAFRFQEEPGQKRNHEWNLLSVIFRE